MRMKKKPDVGGKKKEAITVDVKKQIIRKYEDGMRVKDLARHFNKSASTICTILKNKEKILELDTAKGVTINVSMKQRPRVIEDVEKLLLVWINEKQLAGDSISEAIICEKAKRLYINLSKESPGTSSETVEFKASRGWFERFKKRTGMHSLGRHGESASSDQKAVEEFVKNSLFKTLVDAEQFIPQKVFNCDERSTQNEIMLPGHKPMEESRLLFNARGENKIKNTLKTEPVREILSLKKYLGHDVEELDVEKLVVKHNEDLNIDELKELHQQEYEQLEQTLTEEEEQGEKNKLSIADIRKHTEMWLQLQTFVQENHPDKAVVIRAINLFNNNVMCHFSDMLISRKKQVFTKKFCKQEVKVSKENDSETDQNPPKKRKLSYNGNDTVGHNVIVP